MVASDIDESVLVLAETAFSHSANGFHSIDATGRESRSNTRRRTSQRAIVTRASLKGFSSATFSVLKETYETWGHDHKNRFTSVRIMLKLVICKPSALFRGVHDNGVIVNSAVLCY